MDSPNLDLNNLKALKVLGKGAMGTVFLVQHDTTTTTTTSSSSSSTQHSLMALKVFHKTSTHSHHHSDRRARWEIQVLSRFTTTSHPFLPSLLGTFETEELLGWALPYCPGGDLDSLRYRQTDHVFSPAVIRFYLAEILCALEHLHSIGIAYRDLKPENVLINGSGHVTLTDFDLSRNLSRAAKVIKNESKQHEFQVEVDERRKHHDNFACIEAPLERKNQSKKSHKKLQETCRKNGTYRNNFAWTKRLSEETNQNDKGLKKTKSARVSPVTRRKVAFTTTTCGERSNSFVGTEEYVSPEVVRGEGHEFAVDWWALGVLSYEMLYGATPFKGKNRKETYRNVLLKEPEFVGKKTALTDLITRLLEKDPVKRLGYVGGASEIKEHEFFKGVKWDLLTEVVMRPPFIPSRDDDDGFVGGGGCVGVGEDIRDYFDKLKSPPLSFTHSPSPSSEFMNGDNSFADEF